MQGKRYQASRERVIRGVFCRAQRGGEGDGVQSLPLWCGGRYALSLTDLHIPDVDGRVPTPTIRADRELRRPALVQALEAVP